MELIEEFGIDPVLLAAQIVNFLVIFYILKRFMYKPVLEMLKKREDAIKEGIKQAEEGRALLEKSIEEESKILRKAQEEAKKIVEQARNQAVEMTQQLEEDARKRADKILEDAKAQIEQETKEAEKRLTTRISDLSMAVLSKSVKELFDETEEKKIVSKAVKKLKVE